MSKVVQEWIRKADSDWRTANLIWGAPEPNYDAVCFHTQQCVEKMMKALLISRQQVPPYTHNLIVKVHIPPVCGAWFKRLEVMVSEPDELGDLSV
jgi:hypothetical protein